MKIIGKFLKAIRRLFRTRPVFAPAIATKMPPGESYGPSTGICQACFTCEKGISPDVTVPMFRKAQAEGHIPQSWFEEPDSCQVCYNCEKCFSGQD
jgi:hypothetical protein